MVCECYSPQSWQRVNYDDPWPMSLMTQYTELPVMLSPGLKALASGTSRHFLLSLGLVLTVSRLVLPRLGLEQPRLVLILSLNFMPWSWPLLWIVPSIAFKAPKRWKRYGPHDRMCLLIYSWQWSSYFDVCSYDICVSFQRKSNVFFCNSVLQKPALPLPWYNSEPCLILPRIFQALACHVLSENRKVLPCLGLTS